MSSKGISANISPYMIQALRKIVHRGTVTSQVTIAELERLGLIETEFVRYRLKPTTVTALGAEVLRAAGDRA
ncbi:hypothetical protein [Corynebacterium phocae]|uniref:hypothetical protein n=1 Tax=Corynebacterium phocae TaxID=161895 RepID=UPI00123898A7|nr:hypothetical protein [Corynebacterium phocae]KAA8723023.1 hypothetical protein F4V58_06735 [Corynebacterium phocae]